MSQALKSKVMTYVSKRDEADGVLYFTLSDLNVSIANSLRRVILSDIPTLAFKTFPDKENQANITTNTSRFNNEILKQRLACIPIHGLTHDQPWEELIVIIDKQNDTHDIQFVTTEDFKVKNEKSDKFLADSVVRKMFPPDSITSDFIVLARLRPRISNEVPGEALQIQAKMSLQTAEDDGAYNVVSCCTYRNTPDKVRQDQAWSEEVKTIADEDKEMARNDWYNHQAGRIYIADSFDFKIQTLGVFTNSDIVDKACNILIQDITAFADSFKSPEEADSFIMSESRSTITNSYDIKLPNIGYTIGKVFEYFLHEKYYKTAKILSYVGFRKNHPHDSYSIIRLAFREAPPDAIQDIIKMFQDVCLEANKTYSKIASEFN